MKEMSIREMNLKCGDFTGVPMNKEECIARLKKLQRCVTTTQREIEALDFAIDYLEKPKMRKKMENKQ